MHEQFSHPDLAHVRNHAHESLFNFQFRTECIKQQGTDYKYNKRHFVVNVSL